MFAIDMREQCNPATGFTGRFDRILNDVANYALKLFLVSECKNVRLQSYVNGQMVFALSGDDALNGFANIDRSRLSGRCRVGSKLKH